MTAKARKTKLREITDYDSQDLSKAIDRQRPLTFEEMGVTLPPVPPTQVVSIRLPTAVLNELKAFSSQRDIPYQALIKLYLVDGLARQRKKSA